MSEAESSRKKTTRKRGWLISPECERQDHGLCTGAWENQPCTCPCHPGSHTPGVSSARTVAGVLWALAWLALLGGLIAAFTLGSSGLLSPIEEDAVRIVYAVYGVGAWAALAGSATLLNVLVAIYERLEDR